MANIYTVVEYFDNINVERKSHISSVLNGGGGLGSENVKITQILTDEKSNVRLFISLVEGGGRNITHSKGSIK